jgi:hypothetical protein
MSAKIEKVKPAKGPKPAKPMKPAKPQKQAKSATTKSRATPTVPQPGERAQNARTSSGLVLGGPPRANLLPPEVLEGVKSKSLRRRLFLGVALVAVVMIGATLVASASAATNQGELDAANLTTGELLAEQNSYLEVRQVIGRLDSIDMAQQIGTSTEVNWKAYVAEIEGTLPAGTSVTNLSVVAATPTTNYAEPSSPLQGDRMGQVSFTATSASLPDVEQWLNALRQVTGYVDAAPSSVTLDEGIYGVDILMHFDSDALLNRFAAADDGEGE